MTTDRTNEFEKQLAARGWRYDVENEEFLDGDRLLEWEDVIGLIPGLSFDDLAAYQDRKHDEWQASV